MLNFLDPKYLSGKIIMIGILKGTNLLQLIGPRQEFIFFEHNRNHLKKYLYEIKYANI